MSAAENIDGLLDALAPEGAPDQACDDHPWQVTDLSAADWASRKIAQAKRKIDAVQQERDRLVAKIDAWAERETAGAQRDVSFFESKLISWLQAELAADPDGKKSRNLPSGATVKRVSGREKLVVEDGPSLVEWLRDKAPDKIEFVPKWSADDVKKLIKSDGEVPAGARLERGEDSYAVVIP